ncbi:ATP-binding cassette domain-containing protein [Nesterenkonia sp. LB17]|uniref:methionine ABC transporter ATP-binding protein n=1 Tax=unclassified Nesterenkonia TaxID=2629769 RepID=UPI001F4CDE7B|nr:MULTISPECIES: ATP-binding cassette domain-containing protein [unclassified Nesterenkonia]MCH8560111.1 ATP-binding cassette domain-containing protein [Nesterenkonia sp. DZ6]MCH8564176.1 ATP-binding cassette domain-containing protein [Nesterenkonia sp. LB17]
MISLSHVSTTFAARGHEPLTAVDDVSLEVPRGSIQGIIGFSGAGKSTLLRNINLLERPTSGQVSVAGTELTGLDDAALRRARHQIGMIFQGFNLVNNLSVAQNVELSLKFAGVKDRRERLRRAAEALEIVDITDKASVYPAQLSGGQKQRVAIARALATKPEVLLCDEPTSALDPFTTATVLQYLADVNREFGITVVIVTHEMEVIKALADNVAVMEDGRVVEEFPASELRREGFNPRTSIGKYLLSDGIRLDRSGPAAHGSESGEQKSGQSTRRSPQHAESQDQGQTRRSEHAALAGSAGGVR